MTLTQRVIAQVRLFPGYSADYYAAAAGVTREQFRTVARRHLTARKPGDDGWDFSYTAYFPKDSAAPPEGPRGENPVNVIFTSTDHEATFEFLLGSGQFEFEQDARDLIAVAQMSPEREWLAHANDTGGTHVALRARDRHVRGRQADRQPRLLAEGKPR